jgi:hypothetical protein
MAAGKTYALHQKQIDRMLREANQLAQFYQHITRGKNEEKATYIWRLLEPEWLER